MTAIKIRPLELTHSATAFLAAAPRLRSHCQLVYHNAWSRPSRPLSLIAFPPCAHVNSSKHMRSAEKIDPRIYVAGSDRAPETSFPGPIRIIPDARTALIGYRWWPH
jgi:hypothetical protein